MAEVKKAIETGTCALLDRIAEALGEDIADWMASPSQNTRLGEL